MDLIYPKAAVTDSITELKFSSVTCTGALNTTLILENGRSIRFLSQVFKLKNREGSYRMATTGTLLCRETCKAPFLITRGGPDGPSGVMYVECPCRIHSTSSSAACLPECPVDPRIIRFTPENIIMTWMGFMYQAEWLIHIKLNFFVKVNTQKWVIVSWCQKQKMCGPIPRRSCPSNSIFDVM